MINYKNILIVVGFKITWISSIFGELYINSWIGFIAGSIFILIAFYHQQNKIYSLYAILIISLSGYLFDSIMSYNKYYLINSEINFLFLPLWFLTLWPSFSLLLLNFSSIIINNKAISVFISGLIGPLTYYTGVSIDLVSISGPDIFILISIFWISLIYFFAKYYSTKIIN